MEVLLLEMDLRPDLVVRERHALWDDDQLVTVVVQTMDDCDAAPGEGGERAVDLDGDALAEVGAGPRG